MTFAKHFVQLNLCYANRFLVFLLRHYFLVCSKPGISSIEISWGFLCSIANFSYLAFQYAADPQLVWRPMVVLHGSEEVYVIVFLPWSTHELTHRDLGNCSFFTSHDSFSHLTRKSKYQKGFLFSKPRNKNKILSCC